MATDRPREMTSSQLQAESEMYALASRYGSENVGMVSSGMSEKLKQASRRAGYSERQFEKFLGEFEQSQRTARHGIKLSGQREITEQIERAGGKVVYRDGTIVGAEIGEKSYGIKELQKGVKVSMPSEVAPSRFAEPPPSVVSPAPSFGESFKEYVSGKPKITSTLSFAGETISGWFAESKFSPVRRSGYDKPVGKLGAKTAEIGPYFTPGVSAPLIFATSLEMLGTKAGRKEIVKTSEELEKEYGIRKKYTIPTQVGLYMAGGYFGAKGTIATTEKMLGLPKTETRLLGVQQRATDKKIITETAFESRTKRLFGTKTELGVTRAETYFKPSTKIQVGETFTLGKFGTKAVSLPSAKIKIISPKQFQASSTSVSRPSIIKLEKEIKGLKVSKEFEGFEQISTGRIAVGKDIFKIRRAMKVPSGKIIELPSKIKKEYFVGAGKGFEFGKPTFIFGKTSIVREGKLLRVGRGKYAGLIFKKQPTPKVYDVKAGGGLELKSTIPLQYPQEVVKSAEVFSVAVTPKIKPFTPRIVPVKTEQVMKPTIQVQELKPTIKPAIIQAQKEFQVTKIKITPMLKSTLKPITREKIKVSPILKTTLKIKPEVKEKISPMLRQTVLVKERAIGKLIYGLPAPTIPTGKKGIIFPIPILPTFSFGKRKPTRKLTRLLKSQPTEYKPTFTARAYGIKAFKIPKGYALGAGGIIGRPMIQVRKKK